MKEFETLYRTHASAIFRFALGLCGDWAQAEDIVSETFLRALTRAPRIESRTALAYLLAIARNTYLSGQRRRKREVPLPEDLPAPIQDPAGRIQSEDCLAATLHALRDLPEGERAALLLRVDHDLPYEEIAATLGISVGAAKVRVHRARLHLASALNSSGGYHEA
jgi:RNA polymerase sigma-70 factor (ECF subfamily)